MAEQKIGIMVGCEWSWPPAFLNEINRRKAAVTAELVKLDGTRLAESCPYRVIVDRISHEIPYYRTFLKTAVLAGTTVINNPFWGSAYDRFFNASLVARMGFFHPRMVALPPHTHGDGILEDSLRNLRQAIPWEEHVNYLGGFPVVLRTIRDTAMRRVHVLHSYEELWHAYENLGSEPMLLREHISWDSYIRCICIGQEYIMPIRYVPCSSSATRYFQDESYLTLHEKQQVIESALKINQALGFDINAIDFAFKDGALYAVDVTNPVPDFDVNTLTPYFFDHVVKATADYAIQVAREQRTQMHEFAWGSYIQPVRSASEMVEHSTPHLRLTGSHWQIIEQKR